MKDLTNYSDNELSLMVFNTEYFYVERHTPDFLFALCKEEFYFTAKQMEVLKQDLADDEEEA
jgi:hypothetical protein